MELVAHSPPKNNPDIKPHTYAAHIQEMLDYGMALLDYILSFSSFSEAEKIKLRATFKAALMLHDMGKLDDENQPILRGEKNTKLPIDHIDAGTAIAENMNNQLLGWLIRGHHAPGLVDATEESGFARKLKRLTTVDVSSHSLRGGRHKRIDNEDSVVADYEKHAAIIKITNQRLDDYIQKQRSVCGDYPELAMFLPNDCLTVRIMLSCLVDADHTSAAIYSKLEPMKVFKPVNGNWQQRLAQLDNYVSSLDKSSYENKSKRNQLRHDFYHRCRQGELFIDNLVTCSAPVGLGKTTAVTAYLLRKAQQVNASRMFIVAPFTNIINQTVQTLREAIVLADESTEETVVAHHHQADFSHKEMRQYAASWQAPIVVTTAVQFFETLASAHPSKLKKIHAIVGSVIFIDESHACLPPKYLRIAWYWLRKLADDWGCHVVFSSGSMVAFWKESCLVDDSPTRDLPDILSEDIKKRATLLETKRLRFKRIENTLTQAEFIQHVIEQGKDIADTKKPCILIILNTVQSAAYMANSLAQHVSSSITENLPILEERSVLHLSTGLTPSDRVKILLEIKRRQGSSEWDNSVWYLVATSCVEAGVDLDFSVGYRERCSLTSYLQIAGRVNRHGWRDNAILYDFNLHKDGEIIEHPGFADAILTFNKLWPEVETINQETNIIKLVTRSLINEFLRDDNQDGISKKIMEYEKARDFQHLMNKFKIIDSDTITVLVNKDILERLERKQPVSWQEIQNYSVQLWASKKATWRLRPINNCSADKIYSWLDQYEYNDFLGIFAGFIKLKAFFKEHGGVL